MSITHDVKYLNLARHFSTWSKDPSTQVGAVVIGEAGQVLSQGYNGFPRGVDDSPERYDNRVAKYKFVVHAEMNCIYNASYNGASLKGATLYVHGLPVCAECAKGIIQVGIKRIVIPFTPDELTPDKWKASTNTAREMFVEADVKYQTLDIESGKFVFELVNK